MKYVLFASKFQPNDQVIIPMQDYLWEKYQEQFKKYTATCVNLRTSAVIPLTDEPRMMTLQVDDIVVYSPLVDYFGMGIFTSCIEAYGNQLDPHIMNYIVGRLHGRCANAKAAPDVGAQPPATVSLINQLGG